VRRWGQKAPKNWEKRTDFDTNIRRKGYVIGKEGCIWTQKRRM